jgi:hypothetical protein
MWILWISKEMFVKNTTISPIRKKNCNVFEGFTEESDGRRFAKHILKRMVDWKCQLLLLCERLVAHLTQSSFDYVYFIKIEVALHTFTSKKTSRDITGIHTGCCLRANVNIYKDTRMISNGRTSNPAPNWMNYSTPAKLRRAFSGSL